MRALCCTGCAGIIYLLSAKLLVRFHIDDPLEAAPVHMFCGAFGLIVYATLFLHGRRALLLLLVWAR